MGEDQASRSVWSGKVAQLTECLPSSHNQCPGFSPHRHTNWEWWYTRGVKIGDPKFKVILSCTVTLRAA